MIKFSLNWYNVSFFFTLPVVGIISQSINKVRHLICFGFQISNFDKGCKYMNCIKFVLYESTNISVQETT